MGDIEEKSLLSITSSHGLGITTAAIFLAGEMAGSGVLALPSALVGTGPSGLFLIVFFTINAAYGGSRLGLCWEILAESHEELREEHIRDPYPLIAEKAGNLKRPWVGKVFRHLASTCIILTLYGGACVFLVLTANFMYSLTGTLSQCLWMVIVASAISPVTWFGTPKDFWPIAVGALLTTITACILAIIQLRMDVTSNHVYDLAKCPGYNASVHVNDTSFHPHLPRPTADGYFKAFGGIMFAFGGASTFPTIQADMKDKSKFKYAAVIAMLTLFCIYFPTAAVGYFSLGDCVNDNIIMSMSEGPMKTAAQIVLLIHLLTALPIVINPPSQFFEELMKIPTSFNWKRCLFRTATVYGLLFIGETVPSFGSILDLVGASTITCLTFVMPPYLYIIVVDDSPTRNLSLVERCYCWFLITVGIFGGCSATFTAIKNIVDGASFQPPCYVDPF